MPSWAQCLQRPKQTNLRQTYVLGYDYSGATQVTAEGLRQSHATFVKAVADRRPLAASDAICCILFNCTINMLPSAGKRED